jgi:hypothetical protein
LKRIVGMNLRRKIELSVSCSKMCNNLLRQTTTSKARFKVKTEKFSGFKKAKIV